MLHALVNSMDMPGSLDFLSPQQRDALLRDLEPAGFAVG
jgi:hypothetical protein